MQATGNLPCLGEGTALLFPTAGFSRYCRGGMAASLRSMSVPARFMTLRCQRKLSCITTLRGTY